MEGNGPCKPLHTRDVVRAYLDVLALGEPFLYGLWQRSGVSLTQMRILRILEQSQHTAGSLAQAAGLPKSSLSRVLIRLEEKNLVRRETDRTDRRRVHIILTDGGIEALGRWPQAVLSELARAVDTMPSDERQTFVESVARFTEHVRRVQESPAHAAPAAQDGANTGPAAAEAALPRTDIETVRPPKSHP